jgi:hypothetical protein
MEQKWAKNGCGLWSDDDEIVQADLGGVLVGTFPSFCLHILNLSAQKQLIALLPRVYS